MHRHPENLVKKPVVDDRSDKGAGGQQGVHVPERPLGNSQFDIGGEAVIEDPVMFPEEHLAEFVAFQRAE